MIMLVKEWKGSILDIGGGGEGIIGRLYGDQVIAIDKDQEELDDAPDGFKKIRMDATELAFEDGSFDHVTFFFSLMFMNRQEQQKAILEAARVLKSEGEMHIWDCEIDSAYPQPFCLNVEIRLPQEKICTTYGIGKQDGQDEASVIQMCLEAGLELLRKEREAEGFSLCFRKKKERTRRCTRDGAVLY